MAHGDLLPSQQSLSYLTVSNGPQRSEPLLPPDLTRDETAKQRFLQEAKAASALDHPNICNIHEINETPDEQLYLVIAHYDGETLKERITRGPLEINEAIDIAPQVGQGLAKAFQPDAGLPADVVFDDAPQRGQAIPPADLLTFMVRPAVIRDPHLVDPNVSNLG